MSKWEDLKEVTITVTVRVQPSVSDETVFRQIADSVDEDSWNWDVEMDLTGSQVVRLTKEDGEL